MQKQIEDLPIAFQSLFAELKAEKDVEEGSATDYVIQPTKKDVQEEYEQLDYEWQEQLELRSELKDKPSDLKRYEEKLKQATFNYNRAEGYSSKGKHSTAKKFYNKSESLCEDALEILQEILHYDSSLRVWFDRDISFEVGGDLSADIVSLPRLVTSRSHEKLRDDSRLTSKQRVKLAVVERSVYNIGRDAAPATKPTASRLDKFLSTDD